MPSDLIESKTQSKFGKLYLVPIPITPDGLKTLPECTIEQIFALNYFVVENARTARRFVSSMSPPTPVAELTFVEIDKHGPLKPAELLKPLSNGTDVGIMSEAGCPGIADPGARLAKYAHSIGAQVCPLVGPSSILLAIMGSGLESQKFTFHGYLPRDRQALRKTIRDLERISRQSATIQTCIEAPYRNDKLLQFLLDNLFAETILSVAVDLTAPTQEIYSFSVARWKKGKTPNLHKRPAIFSFLAT